MTRAFRLTVRPTDADLVLLVQIVEMRFQLRNGEDGIVSRELADRLLVLDPGKTPEQHYASFAMDMLGQWDIEPIRGGPVVAVTGGPSADPLETDGSLCADCAKHSRSADILPSRRKLGDNTGEQGDGPLKGRGKGRGSPS
ncbi:MAG: hypothetical protein WA957_01325 [Alteraurantiacibacter sp.]